MSRVYFAILIVGLLLSACGPQSLAQSVNSQQTKAESQAKSPAVPGQIGREKKTAVVEGKFRTIPGAGEVPTVFSGGKTYRLTMVPSELKQKESEGKVEEVRVLGVLEGNQLTPLKLQMKVEGEWVNVELAEQIVCNDNNCRNCKVKCGNSCECSKWKKK